MSRSRCKKKLFVLVLNNSYVRISQDVGASSSMLVKIIAIPFSVVSATYSETLDDLIKSLYYQRRNR